MTRALALDSSFLSITSVTPKAPASPKVRQPRRRPSPIDLYELSTLEALPTPASSSSHAPSYDSQSLDTVPVKRRTRRLRKPTSASDMNGVEKKLGGFGKRRKEKDNAKADSIKQATANSFLPMDEDVKAAPLPASSIALPPSRVRAKAEPASLDPSIFGHEIKIVKAEDPIEQVIRLNQEERVRQIQRSFAPSIELARPPSRQRGQTLSHRPPPSLNTARTAGGSTRQRHHAPMPSIQGVIESDGLRYGTETKGRRGTMQMPVTHPSVGDNHAQALGRGRAGSIRSVRTECGPSSPPSSPIREYLYPVVDEVQRTMSPPLPSGRPPTYFSAKRTSPIRPTSSPTPSVDGSPTLGSMSLPKRRERHHSLTPSTSSQIEHAWRSSRHVEPDEEQLTALEILEELNADQEEGWELGVLAKERSHAGLEEVDKLSKRRYGMATMPAALPRSMGSAPESTSDREGSMKDVRSWRETRKKSREIRPQSEQQRPRSLKPKRSVEGLEPLYEVSYTIEPDLDRDLDRAMSPPPVPPRAAGRGVAQLKLEIERVQSRSSSKMGVDEPLVLDSPVKETRMGEAVTRVEDVPHGVSRQVNRSLISTPQADGISPAMSPTPIHLRPLPPLPNLPPLAKPLKSINPLASFKQSDGLTRLLRPKRASGSARPVMTPPMHHSTPPSFTEPHSPLDSPPPSSPRPRLSAREEPHAGLPHRPTEPSFTVDRASSRKQGMTALSFLALDDPTLSYSKATTESPSARNSLDFASRRRESVQAHIIPPEELAKLYHRRRSSSASESGVSRASMILLKDDIKVPVGRQDARMSFGLSPPPRTNRRSFEPPPRVDEDASVTPISLSPPPRTRHSLKARRPSLSPSPSPTPMHIDTHPSYAMDSYLDISPSPSPLNCSPITPLDVTPRRLGSSTSHHSHRDITAPPPSSFHGYRMDTIGHASELRGAEMVPPARELDRQALNEWLAQPRARKASVPVNGVSRIRPGVYV